jgi:hypothetical protein
MPEVSGGSTHYKLLNGRNYPRLIEILNDERIENHFATRV